MVVVVLASTLIHQLLFHIICLQPEDILIMVLFKVVIQSHANGLLLGLLLALLLLSFFVASVAFGAKAKIAEKAIILQDIKTLMNLT